MKAVIQRVSGAMLSVGGETVSEIGKGLVVYLGVGKGDKEDDCAYFAKKIASMRIFEDGEGRMNLSALSEKAEVLLVSQFTLYGDTAHGNRPSFTGAEAPVAAERLYLLTAESLRALGLSVKTGVFGADMKINQINDGPVTILLERYTNSSQP